MKKVVFIVPCYNMASNFDALYESVREQTNKNWLIHFIDDMSTDKTWEKICSFEGTTNEMLKRYATQNAEKKYALRNIVEVARTYQDDDDIVIAIIDGDDQLCNPETVNLLLHEYENGAEVVWTAHKWDVNNMNISKPMPDHVNPHMWSWCSSHLKTFKASLLINISDKNFQDLDGKWFTRGYDQALMLAVLTVSKKRVYIPEVCYLYNIDSVSIPQGKRNWAEREQLQTINLVRARGFIKD